MKKLKKNIIAPPDAPALAPERTPPAAISTALRALIAAVLVCGLIAFMCEAFGFEMRAVYALACVLSCAIFALMSLSRRLFAAGAVALLLAGGAWALLSGAPLRRLALALDALSTGITNRLTAAGFSAFSPFSVGVSSAADGIPERDLAAALTVLAIVLSALICASTLRRVRLFAPSLAVMLILGYVFIYNLSRSSLPLAVVISGCAGLIAMRICDGRRLRESAAGGSGFAGLAGALAAALVLFPAAALIKNPAPVIPVIDERMQYARALLSSEIMGDLPAMMELGFSGYMETFGDRSTEASARSFSGKEIMTVQTGLPSTVYMRSWVGMDYSDNSWKAADSSQASQWRESFGEGFLPELLTQRFFALVDPTLTRMSTITSSRDRSEHGFISTFVDITTRGSSGNLLSIPSVFNAERGFTAAGSDEPYTAAANSYFDGVFTTDWTNFNRSYRALAHLPTLTSPNYEETILRDFASRSLLINVAERYFQLGDSPELLLLLYFDELEQLGLTERAATLLDELADMNTAERAQWYYDYVELPAAYDAYVAETYTSAGDEGAWLEAVCERIRMAETEYGSSYFADVAGDRTLLRRMEARHNTAMQVMEYLRDNYTYTLSPREPSEESGSALYEFLADTGEGYCVQFATSAVLLLRSFGIPARYVEGYIADEFSRNGDQNRTNYYISTVHDYNAHAWVEVYYEGYGWMQYEATPPYMSLMYDKVGGISTLPAEQETPQETELPEPEEEDEEDEDEEDDENTSPVLVIWLSVLLAAAAVTVAALLLRAAVLARRRREVLTQRAIYGAPSGEELQQLAREVADGIIAALAVTGLTQRRGELPLDFAARIDAAFLPSGEDGPELPGGPPSRLSAAEIFPLIERGEFGGGMSAGELSLCGEYMSDIQRFAYKNAGIFKKFYLRYVKRTL